MALKWFQLVDAAGKALTRMHYVSVDVPFAAGLRKAVYTEYATTFLAGIAPSELVVYANRAAFDAKRVPSEFDPIDSLGESPRDPLIVQAPPSNIPTMKRKWFQLVDAAGKALTIVDYVSIDTTMVATLRGAVKTKNADSRHLAGIAPIDLVVYASREAMNANQPLKGSDPIDSFGESDEDPLIVQVSPGIPPLTVLENADLFTNECGSLTTWEIGVAHEIKLIHEFMKPLGGCTKAGTIFWRSEEQQLVALLMSGWFPDRSTSIWSFVADKRSSMVGSPGVGKSTLLCLLAFFTVLIRKKNVLVYRRLQDESEYALLYLGWEQDSFVWFSIPNCSEELTAKIYHSMRPGVELWLDGFVYKDVPKGLRAFAFLATSQGVDLKSHAGEHAYCCLLPCWRQEDLFALGRAVFKYSEDEMKKRFKCSGGSVRDFAAGTVMDIQIAIDHAVSSVKNPEELLSSAAFVFATDGQADRIRHTFLKKEVEEGVDPAIRVIYRKYWEQVVDSEFAVSLLHVRMRSDALYRIYEWARRSNNASLAGCVFEVMTHRLAGDNMLQAFRVGVQEA